MTNTEIKELNLTDMESKALQALIDGLYAEPGFSDVDANDISKMTKIDISKIRGVISSLVKKGIVYVDTSEVMPGSGTYLIELNSEYWYLHPEWKDADQY